MNQDYRNLFITDLLRQDEAISDTVVKELRTRLTQALENAERRAGAMRRATIISCVVLVGAILVEILIIGLVERFEMETQWMVAGGGMLVLISLVVAGSLLCLYNDRYRTAVNERRTDLQMAILTDLQRQVAELKHAQNRAEDSRKNTEGGNP